MIKDFIQRKAIAREAKLIVSNYFNEGEKRKLANSSKSKAVQRIESLTKKIRTDASSYKQKRNLGIYGTAKLAKEIQTALEQEELDAKAISFVVNSIVRG